MPFSVTGGRHGPRRPLVAASSVPRKPVSHGLARRGRSAARATHHEQDVGGHHLHAARGRGQGAHDGGQHVEGAHAEEEVLRERRRGGVSAGRGRGPPARAPPRPCAVSPPQRTRPGEESFRGAGHGDPRESGRWRGGRSGPLPRPAPCASATRVPEFQPFIMNQHPKCEKRNNEKAKQKTLACNTDTFAHSSPVPIKSFSDTKRCVCDLGNY